jgi:hypothetical protein
MRRTLVESAAALALLLTSAGPAGAQMITAGSIPAAPNFGFNPTPVMLTAVDLSFPATGQGDMMAASFVWSLAPCAATVKIKFFRPSGNTLVFLAERGPFDVTTNTEVVALTPSVSVQAGDVIGIARVAGCGSPVGQSPGAATGLVAFAGDIATSVSISSGTAAANSTLAVEAFGSSTGGPPANPASVIPVVISGPGLAGATFRTAVQLHNPTASMISGRLIFHMAGVSGTSTDPSLPYALGPGQTVFLGDVVFALGQSGVGSLDIVVSAGSAPVASVRVFNDGGPAGTNGFTEQGMKPVEALSAGMRAVLLAPFDPVLFRFNVGVRTLSTGATIALTVRDSGGAVLRTLTRTYAANFFEQTDVASFLGGLPLAANQSVTVDVVSGSLFLYGATADNRTNDPALDFARNVL